MWQPFMDDPEWDGDSSQALVPGWGPYLFITGWSLLLTSPTVLVMGAPRVARLYGDLPWVVFVVFCVLATMGGMALLVHHRRWQSPSQPLRQPPSAIPASEQVWGLGLLGLLATSSIVVFVIRWLR